MRKIFVIGGGNQSEFVISVKSAKQVAGALDRSRYEVYVIQIKGTDWNALIGDQTLPIDKNDFSFMLNGQKIKAECAVIVIHGSPGEDGKLQAYFELLSIPYTTCGVMSSALTFNKYASKQMLKPHNVKMAKGILVKKGEKPDAKAIATELGFPIFVKPNEAGSSFGVSKVNDVESLAPAIEHALSEGTEVIIESFISGTEVSCGVARIGGELITFPITEIVSTKEFFDYEAKYTTGLSQEITPARLSPEVVERCNVNTRIIYDALSCRSIVRVDYIISDGIPYFLEINTVPGMSANSIIPQQIRCMGKNVTDVYTQLIEEAIAGTL
jgi:D-alanine-D-alanine ligase